MMTLEGPTTGKVDVLGEFGEVKALGDLMRFENGWSGGKAAKGLEHWQLWSERRTLSLKMTVRGRPG